MALVPFKNLLRFLQKKCDKHLKIDKKDLSRVAKFVSHNGNFYRQGANYYRQFAAIPLTSNADMKCNPCLIDS